MFIDESGDFSVGDRSFVGGLLVERGADAGSSPRLRKMLAEIWGPGPWPPHASHLNQPASRVLYALRPDMPAGRHAALPEMRRLLDVLRDSSMGPQVDEIERGRFPTWNDIQRAEDLLRGRPEYRTLAAAATQQERAMARLVANVCGRLNGTVIAVQADEEPPGPPPAPLQLREDSYVRALTLVVDRLARLADAVDLEVHVLTREVEVGTLGNVGMQGHFLRPIFERITAETGGRVRLRAAGAVQRYRDLERVGAPLHPLLVVADWLTNHLRAAAGWHRGDYTGLEAQLQRALVPSPGVFRRTPASAPALGALPTIAAAGEPERAVRRALGGGGEDAARLSAGTGWRWDQAREWAATAGRWP